MQWPFQGHSGQNRKVVKLVKGQSGQTSKWSNFETGQNVKVVKSQSGQIHLAFFRELRV